MTKIIIAITALLFLSCTQAVKQEPCTNICPPEDAYYFVMTSGGPLLTKMPKGYFNNKGNWKTEEEFDKLKRKHGVSN